MSPVNKILCFSSTKLFNYSSHSLKKEDWINLKNVENSWIFRKNKIFKISKRVLSASRF